jgi:AcrR family transcriptional regulator
MTRRRTGRRPGRHDTREDILAAARDRFADYGYDGASVRQIATSAGVDPALVYHYFGTKESLFRAAIGAPIDPAAVFPRIWAGDPAELGERIVRTFLGVWEDPTTGPAIRATVRSAVANDRAARLLREFFATQVVRRIVHELGMDGTPEEGAVRSSLVASQLFGVALARYVLQLPPLADLPVETVVTAVAPTVQRYLTGDLAISEPSPRVTALPAQSTR